MKEEWRPINDFVGEYEVSNLGRVKSLDRLIITSHGVRRMVRGRVLGSNVPSSRYCYVSLKGSRYNRKAFTHVLVAEHFIGEKPDGLVIDHINNDSRDNRVENLQYITQRHNSSKDRVRKYELPHGIQKVNSKFSPRKGFGKKIYNLGVFDTVEEAHAVYMSATLDDAINIERERRKYFGVHFDSYSGKYRALIANGKKRYHIGMFHDRDDAAKAVQEKRMELGLTYKEY